MCPLNTYLRAYEIRTFSQPLNTYSYEPLNTYLRAYEIRTFSQPLNTYLCEFSRLTYENFRAKHNNLQLQNYQEKKSEYS
jgi:hypothetical protein